MGPRAGVSCPRVSGLREATAGLANESDPWCREGHIPAFAGRRRRSTVAKNLYVGNMAFSTTEEALREAFSQYGTVTKVQLIMDRDTGRPRGFAFVEMRDGGDQAIAALNGSQLDGRSLTVNEAKPRESGGGRGGYGGGGYRGGRQD